MAQELHLRKMVYLKSRFAGTAVLPYVRFEAELFAGKLQEDSKGMVGESKHSRIFVHIGLAQHVCYHSWFCQVYFPFPSVVAWRLHVVQECVPVS
jgi:hypothetical protein